MQHWWQGWSIVKCCLFATFIVLLNVIATNLARTTHSTMVLVLVEIAGILSLIWAGRILIWNFQHANDSPQKE
jgi:threonine/homoserine/homoserine lactone efflux protein